MPYFHPDASTSEAFRNRIIALESELGVPLRVLYGGGSITAERTERPWAEAHVEAVDHDEDTCNSRGVTIYELSLFSPIEWASRDHFPVELLTATAGGMVPTPTYDLLQPQGYGYNVRYGDGQGYDLQPAPPNVERTTITFMYRPERERNITLNEVRPRNVADPWFLGGFRGTDEQAEMLDWDRLLLDAIRLAASEDFAEQLRTRAQEQARRDIVNYFNRVPEQTVNTLRREVVTHEHGINNARQQITDSIRALRRAQAQLDMALGMQGRSEEEILAEWDTLTDHPRLTSCTMEGGAIVMQVDDLRMSHPATGDSRWLGTMKFYLRVGTEGYSGIQVENLSTPRGNRAHPHCPGNPGEPCLGSLSAVVAEQIANGELIAVFELMLQWAESFNPADDWGRHAVLWFDEPDQDPALNPTDGGGADGSDAPTEDATVEVEA